jgi:hypothetical protein
VFQEWAPLGAERYLDLVRTGTVPTHPPAHVQQIFPPQSSSSEAMRLCVLCRVLLPSGAHAGGGQLPSPVRHCRRPSRAAPVECQGQYPGAQELGLLGHCPVLDRLSRHRTPDSFPSSRTQDDPMIGTLVKRGTMAYAGSGKNSRGTQIWIAFQDSSEHPASPLPRQQ